MKRTFHRFIATASDLARYLTQTVFSIIAVVVIGGASSPTYAECSNNPCAATPVTSSDEPGIPGSRQLVDGLNTTVNTSLPGKIQIDASFQTLTETISVTAVSTPAAPTVEAKGTQGSTTYEYTVVARDNIGNSSPAGLATLNTKGNSTLTGSNYNRVTWSSVSGASSYDIYRIAGPSNTGKIANIVSTDPLQFDDQSNANGDSSLPPAVPTQTFTLGTSSKSTQLLDCTNGNIVVVLPNATTNLGKQFLFKRIDSTKNTATIVGYSNQIVTQNLNTWTLYNKANPLAIQSDGGTTWRTLNQGSGSSWAIAALPPDKTRGCTDWGTNNMLVMGTDGNIYGWGISTRPNIAGGIVSTTLPEIARQVVFDPNARPAAGTYITDWSASSSNLFVALSDGTVYGAGLNDSGQLGLGNTTDSNYLKKITFFNGKTVRKVWAFDAGSSTTIGKAFFLVSTGELYAVGYNSTGSSGSALGVNNQTATYSTPQLVSSIYNPVQIKSAHTPSGSYTMLIDAAGDLYVTGYNGNGQFGAGNTTNLSVFTKVTSPSGPFSRVYVYGANAAAVACSYAALIKTNGDLYLSGKNTSGQLGQGHTTANTHYTWKKPATDNVYTTGTVTVSGTTVTGAGTSWTSIPAWAQSLQIGFGASPSTWYQIWTINSNTSITLGTSATSQPAGTVYTIKAIPPPNPMVHLAYEGNGNNTGCVALDNTGKVWTWGYNGTNNLFYATTDSPQAAPTNNSNLGSGKLISATNVTGTGAAQNSVVWDGVRLRIGGTTLNGLVGATDVEIASGSVAVSLPDSIANGTETITDVFVNNNAADARIFFLTDCGNLYTNGDNTNAVSTGGIAGGPAAVGLYKIGI